MEAVDLQQVDQEDLINHLMFHKALIDEERDGTKIDRYVDLLEEEGQHSSIRDPFDQSIAIAFELALEHHLDPWDLDLARFSTLYLRRAREEEIDLVTAGRIILLAWQVLKLQSAEVVEQAEEPDEPADDEVLGWEAIPDWTFEPEERDFTQTVIDDPEPPLEEPIRRDSSRRVSLFELVEAFDEARQEAEKRQRLRRERERARMAREEAREAADDGDRMHTDDLEAEIERTWQRIRRYNGQPIPLSKLHRASKEDLLRTMVTVLFLAKDHKIRVTQEEFPTGEIYVENRNNGG